MQRKSTPRSHPFHVLFRRPALLLLFGAVLRFTSFGSSVFHIECPPDVTVNCDAELWDLSIYGNATIYGYGDPQSAGPPISVDYNLNNCNIGTIIRTWVAYDYGGHPYYCSQTITVTVGGYVDINWPSDYILHSCNPQTDPEDLPPPYDYPIINGGGGSCSQILTSHDDQIFNINPPACKKILRKWTVVDWCLYDPNSYDPIGIWTHIQIIKITPENPPIIWCPTDTIVSAGADCSGGHVELSSAYGYSDCGAGVTITNNSPYAFSHGANASGNYPLGTTKVTFWADDACGQKTSCSIYVTVKDLKKPTPICFYGITVTLMQMPDGYYMNLRPSFFDKGSFDNCTPKSELKMWVEPSKVGCEELGATPVRLYIEDESGNIEYCNTLVYVQDNLGICPPSDGIIDGVVHSTKGSALNEVKVLLQGTADFSMTDVDGYYAFPSLPFDKAYTISPTYPEDDMSGVTAIDMAALLKHILGTERFSSPYQFIAADLDKSGRVAVSDLLGIKELILKDYYGLHPTTSWRFVDASYIFQNPTDPLSESFPEYYQIPLFTQNMEDLDFIGVKLGDINSDATVNLNETQYTLSRSSAIQLHIPDREFKKGEVFDALVSVSSYEDVEAMQFALESDDELIEIVAIEHLQESHGLDVINRGQDFDMISALWYGIEPLSTSQLFSVKVRALKSGLLSDALRLHLIIKSIAYRKGVDLPYQLKIEFTPLSIDEEPPIPGMVSGMKLRQNYPNPFYAVTTIPIELTESELLEIEVFDMDGRILWQSSITGAPGLQELTLSASVIGVTGIVLCRVTAGTATAAIRMLIQQGLE